MLPKDREAESKEEGRHAAPRCLEQIGRWVVDFHSASFFLGERVPREIKGAPKVHAWY